MRRAQSVRVCPPTMGTVGWQRHTESACRAGRRRPLRSFDCARREGGCTVSAARHGVRTPNGRRASGWHAVMWPCVARDQDSVGVRGRDGEERAQGGPWVCSARARTSVDGQRRRTASAGMGDSEVEGARETRRPGTIKVINRGQAVVTADAPRLPDGIEIRCVGVARHARSLAPCPAGFAHSTAPQKISAPGRAASTGGVEARPWACDPCTIQMAGTMPMRWWGRSRGPDGAAANLGGGPSEVSRR